MNRDLLHSSFVACIKSVLDEYRQEVNATDMVPSAKETYIRHAEHFVRWMDGDFTPGARTRRKAGGGLPQGLPPAGSHQDTSRTGS